MKKTLIFLGLFGILAMPTVAQEASSQASSGSNLVFLKSGDIVFGGRVALGGVAGASFGFAANAEYGIQENIGVGAFFGYSGYKFYEASYTNILVLGSVNYHLDFLKIQNLDTWAAVSLGYNVGTVGDFVWGVTANARYYFTSNLALVASAGYGLGYLQVGLDYKL